MFWGLQGCLTHPVVRNEGQSAGPWSPSPNCLLSYRRHPLLISSCNMVGRPRDGQVRDEVLYVRLTAAEVVLLDRLRGRVTRSAYVRSLLHQAARGRPLPGPPPEPKSPLSH